jgi:hypothetical protein
VATVTTFSLDPQELRLRLHGIPDVDGAIPSYGDSRRGIETAISQIGSVIANEG